MPAKIERRVFSRDRSQLTVTRADDQPTRIGGYGAVFYREDDPGTQYQLWSDVYERIAPGAFDRALQEDRVRSLFNHDPNWVLGSTDSQTLELDVDAVGLRYTVTPPDSQAVRDLVLQPIARGDVTGSSFMFVPRKTAWIEEEIDGRTIDVRELQDVELWEVGPVTFPAYESSTTGLRGLGLGMDEIREDLERTRAARRRGRLAAGSVAAWRVRHRR
jgi:HK97 family phage prohead protease